MHKRSVMSNIAIPSWAYVACMMVILVIAGLAEYIGLAPTGTFYTAFLLVIGLISPSPAFPHTTVVQTPQTTVNASKVDVQPPPPSA
jgi:hypothetical protein